MSFMQIQLFQQETHIINETHPIIQYIISNDHHNELTPLLEQHDINGLYACKELNDKVSPLMAAVAFQKEGIFNFLLHEKADPNAFSLMHWTPLHYASDKSILIYFASTLLAAKADPNGVFNNQRDLHLTPLQAAAISDRHDVSEALISNGAFVTTLIDPKHVVYNDKISKMINNLASISVKNCMELKQFVDLDIQIKCKSTEEVFQFFDRTMLVRNPQTHISILDVFLSFTGPGRVEYHSKGISWLEDNHKINQYIDESMEYFVNVSEELKGLVIQNLDSVCNTLKKLAYYQNMCVRNLQTFLTQQRAASEESKSTTFRKDHKWHKISKKWSEKLEKLSKTEDIIKVGSILFSSNEEFCIAKGSEGTEVFLGLREDGTEVAVKRMTRSSYHLLQNEESFLRLPQLDHPFIVRYIDFAEDANFGYLALQLCERTLEEFLKDDVPEEKKRKLVEEVLSSLSVLHDEKRKIIHRDIKPQNVLLDVTGKARLADFGISRRLPIDQKTWNTRVAGTKGWKAKEMIDQYDAPCKMSADVQVAGMLTYYILSGRKHPFGTDCRCESKILDNDYDLKDVEDVIAKNLIEWMIQIDPKERPTVQQCLEHCFFWKTPRKIRYLKRIGNEEEVRKYRMTDKCLLDELDRDVGEASWKNWKEKFPPEILKTLDGNGKYPENTAGLLRFIRNLLEHPPKDAGHIDLMAIFPDLFRGVYIFAEKKGWNIRNKQIADEEDITSGGAMNTLSLEDQATGFSVPVQESGLGAGSIDVPS